jgi:hypothetical protein
MEEMVVVVGNPQKRAFEMSLVGTLTEVQRMMIQANLLAKDVVRLQKI